MTFHCRDCTHPLQKRSKFGPMPLRCDECKRAIKKQRNAEYYRNVIRAKEEGA